MTSTELVKVDVLCVCGKKEVHRNDSYVSTQIGKRYVFKVEYFCLACGVMFHAPTLERLIEENKQPPP